MTPLMNIEIDKPSKILIGKLRGLQEADGKTEREFAALLGVSAATWNLIRCENTKPGLKFIAGVLRQYPDLDGDILKFLRDEPGLMDMWSQSIPA